MLMLDAIWALVCLAVLAAIVRPWKPGPNRHPLALLLAVPALIWSLWSGHAAYRDLVDQGAWTAASIAIPLVPIKALIFALIGYLAGRMLLSAHAKGGFRNRDQRVALPALTMTAFFGWIVVSDVLASRDAAHVRIARSEELTAEQVTEIVNRIHAGESTDNELNAFLMNPRSPPGIWAEYIDGTPVQKSYLARNPALGADLVVRLSTDVDAQVRYSAILNEQLPLADLIRLSSDPDPVVREGAVWKTQLPDADFSRLITDPEARVRAATAWQSRISDEDLSRLKLDIDPSVRSAATVKANQRGLQ